MPSTSRRLRRPSLGVSLSMIGLSSVRTRFAPKFVDALTPSLSEQLLLAPKLRLHCLPGRAG